MERFREMTVKLSLKRHLRKTHTYFYIAFVGMKVSKGLHLVTRDSGAARPHLEFGPGEERRQTPKLGQKL